VISLAGQPERQPDLKKPRATKVVTIGSLIRVVRRLDLSRDPVPEALHDGEPS